jgi:glycosyltransferase involved in cell wall biosynthesis
VRVVHVSTNSRMTGMLGYEVYALNLALLERASGNDVMMITNRSGVLWEACHRHDIPVVAEPSFNESGAEEAKSALAKQFTDFGATIINCHTPHAASVAIPAGNQLGIPCVFTVHFASQNEDADAGVIVRVRNKEAKFTTICVAKAMFETLKRNGIPEAEVHYVPAGTKPSPRERARETSNSSQPKLMLVGTLEPDKGTDLAILAMAELRRRRGPACPALNIYGTGEGEPHYKEIVDVLQLNDIVRFCGYQSNVLDRCADSDILLMSSRYESGPLVVLEAMSRGMPIVATEVGTVSDMIPDRRYGRIVRPHAIVPLADGVEALLEDISAGVFDPSLSIERHRSLFTIEKMAEHVMAVYTQATAANSTV